MSVTIELKPEIEKRLVNEAEQKGLKIEAYLKVLIEEKVNGEAETSNQKEKHLQETATVEEWVTKLRSYASSHEKTGIALSEEATRRENIY